MCQVHVRSASSQNALDVLAASLLKAETGGSVTRSHHHTKLLLRRLDDPDAEIRWRAAWAIGQMGHAGEVLSSALARRLKDPDAFVRWCAVEALYEMGKGISQHAEELARCLEDQDAFVRSSVAGGFSRLGKAAAPHAAAMERRLLDEEPIVRASAADAFGRAGKVAMPFSAILAQRVLEDESIHVRRKAVWALGRVCEGPALRDISCAFQALATASLEDADAIVRRNAALALAPPQKLGATPRPIVLGEALAKQDIDSKASSSSLRLSHATLTESNATWALRQLVDTTRPHAEALTKKLEESGLAARSRCAVAREQHCVCPKEICGDFFGAGHSRGDHSGKAVRSRTRRYSKVGRQISADRSTSDLNQACAEGQAAASSSESQSDNITL